MSKELFGILSKQNNHYVVSGSIKGSELLDLYNIQELKSDQQGEQRGYQHPLEFTDYRDISNKLKHDDAWLPTSITLSKQVSLDESDNNKTLATAKDDTLSIEYFYTNIGNQVVKITLSDNAKLNVIDGKKRIKALEHVTNNQTIENVDDFEFSYNLLLNKDYADEVNSFYQVQSNETKVATDLALKVLTEKDPEKLEKLTKAQLVDLIALNTVIALNEDKNSVWYHGIAINRIKDSEVISSSKSFVTVLKKLLSGKNASKVTMKYITGSVENNPKLTDAVFSEDEIVKRFSLILNNFWNALRINIPKAFPTDMEEKQDWLIQKTTGLYALNILGAKVLDLMFNVAGIKKLNAESIANFLKQYGGDELNDADFWKSRNAKSNILGGSATDFSSEKGFMMLANLLYEKLETNFKVENPTTVNPEF